MKKLLYICVLGLLLACDSESANNCFQTTGDLIQKEIQLDEFETIFVNKDIELIIKEGPIQKVLIETGKNLMPDVTATVENGKLTLIDNNSCNLIRDYEPTRVYVTSPNITEIRSSTQRDIKSDGVLTYPDLTILSENYGAPGTYTNADFYLEVDNERLTFVFNNLSNAYVTGNTENLSVTFAAGTSRFEGRELIAQKIWAYNRSSNDIIINPYQELKGKISSTGDIISVNKPPIVEVEEVYEGRLIFE
ncbi:head GIN domain-containing protein [Tamlana sp. 2_MG-2023]|uniref:head GIN domain-containing protein n=1 Tax=unclassified Tamlana TaxID=2614803 RepID=UPI0026E14AD8|nr:MULTISPECIES: head GIN domain-containing protein [unclassified Tamlana]MDO6760728.1 head GIN domain-containing protein [Tamlana sp. 2_MG-2023]MDO6790984.1 head GIN domain-containing protein [Tamlana sp. 1_MG-2023]